MSEKLGPRTFGRREEMVFLGKGITEQRNYSDKVAEQIDEEVHDLIDGAYVVASNILTQGRTKLEQLTERLLAEETIEGEELQRILGDPAEASSAQVKPVTGEQAKPVTGEQAKPVTGTTGRRPIWRPILPSEQISPAL